MAVSNYTGNKCTYKHSKLKQVFYLIPENHTKDVHIDNGEAYIDGLSELPLRINGFNIQYNEETSLDERYAFQKTLTLSMHGYVNYQIFGERYYAIIEDVEGTYYMINVDFPSRITHTFNLSDGINQTDFTFSSLSNFPTLKLNAEFEAVSPVCLGFNIGGVDKLQLIEKDYARLDKGQKVIYSTTSLKDIEFLGNSCSFQEVYDGKRVTDTISFNISLGSYKSSWGWNLLEFLENKYAAIITPKGRDNKFYSGFNFGLEPSYTIQTASNQGESDIITITLTETSIYGTTAANDWTDYQRTDTSWIWTKQVGDTKCWECSEYNTAMYLVKQEVDGFGNPTGNYLVKQGYQEQFPNLNIVGTFSQDETFIEASCQEGSTCDIYTDIPDIIYYSSVTSYTYTLNASCDWQFIDVPSNIQVSPMSGVANTEYSVSISNTATPTSQSVENHMILSCCRSGRIINFKTQASAGCIRPQTAYINCLAQTVDFVYDGDCQLTILQIPSRYTYNIQNNILSVHVPKNENDAYASVDTIIVSNCGCDTGYTSVQIRQDKMYSEWAEDETGYICDDGNSYKVNRRYTGATSTNLVRTDETTLGTLIESGSTGCSSYSTKWEWDGESYYCTDGDKFKAIFEWISYDGGVTWVKTGNTRLNSTSEGFDSEFCSLPVTYSWVLSNKYECSGTTSFYLYQQYEQRGGQDSIPVYPNYWSIDADGDEDYVLAKENDVRCGYTPIVEPLYRWTNIDISQDYECDDCGFKCRIWYGIRVISIYSGECDTNTTLSQSDIASTATRGNVTEYNPSYIRSVEIRDCATTIGDNAFSGCTRLTSVTISDSVTSIGSGAFAKCSGLTSVSIPDSVTTIGNDAFYFCSGLASIGIPSGVTTLEEALFYGCGGLTSITIPNSVTSIRGIAFAGCKSLTSITIPDSVTSIGYYAFEYCTSLTSVTCLAVTPPTLSNNVFLDTNNCPIYVPSASVNAYKNAPYWADYASRIQPIT